MKVPDDEKWLIYFCHETHLLGFLFINRAIVCFNSVSQIALVFTSFSNHFCLHYKKLSAFLLSSVFYLGVTKRILHLRTTSDYICLKSGLTKNCYDKWDSHLFWVRISSFWYFISLVFGQNIQLSWFQVAGACSGICWEWKIKLLVICSLSRLI